MARKTTQVPGEARHGPDGSDGIILVSMSLVVAAIVVGLHLQVGLSLVLSLIVGVSLFLGLSGFHAWQHGNRERAALAEELERLEKEVGRLKTASVRAMPPPPRETPASTPLAAAELPSAATEPPQSAGPPGSADVGAHGPREPRLLAEGRPVATTKTGPADSDLEDAGEPELIVPVDSAVREDDVERLQQRIKDMLLQVTAAEQARTVEEAGSVSFGENGADDSETTPVAALGIEASLDALRAAAQSMRARPEAGPATDLARAAPGSAPHEASATTTPQAASLPGGAASAGPIANGSTTAGDAEGPQISALRAAIAAGRVDVFLEPILGLSNQSAQHYEVSIKVRGESCEDLGTGEGDILPGKGLLPLFDSARIARSAIVAERLATRGKTGSVFSRATGEALIEPSFSRDLQVDFSNRQATARQLVLTFAQADIRTFRAAEQRAVSMLGALGFRFAISELTDLDMNFEAMAKAGFSFVKLDAGVMLEGLPHPGGHIPASDVCRYLADQGFGLIVEGIASEETLARVFGFGVLLGQGALFGGRRPVKADVVARPSHAAA